MRDKIPKGDFVLRVGVMDRLVENKMYYKFFEYGNRIKEQKMLDEEREKNKNKSLEDLDLHLSNLMDGGGYKDSETESNWDGETNSERPSSSQI